MRLSYLFIPAVLSSAMCACDQAKYNEKHMSSEQLSEFAAKQKDEAAKRQERLESAQERDSAKAEKVLNRLDRDIARDGQENGAKREETLNRLERDMDRDQQEVGSAGEGGKPKPTGDPRPMTKKTKTGTTSKAKKKK